MYTVHELDTLGWAYTVGAVSHERGVYPSFVEACRIAKEISLVEPSIGAMVERDGADIVEFWQGKSVPAKEIWG